MQQTVSSEKAAPAASAPRRFWQRTDVLVGGVLLVVLLSFASTVDVVYNGYGLKGDEGTYAAAALSVAYDQDLAFERKDLERFWTFFSQGPDGAFFQRARGHYALVGDWPFVRFKQWAHPPNDRLYFGKSFIYPVFVAPFVRLFGLNGFLIFNALLLAGTGVCGFAFLRARTGSRPFAASFTLAFLCVSIVPVYGIWLTPEIFNFAFVFFGLFLWLYKEVAPGRGHDAAAAPSGEPRPRAGFLHGAWSDLLAAALLGMVTFSKVLYAPLVGPVIAWQAWKRRPMRGVAILAVYVAVTGGLFAANAAISGEFSYQGGDRKVFYYPNMVFTTPEMTFDTVGYSKTTTGIHEAVFETRELATRVSFNILYFLVGRHSGLVPYFFPGVIAVLLWAARWRQAQAWQALTFLAALATVVVTVGWMPYTWSGGGGPPGNRYFLAVYPALFFLVPPIESLAVPLLAWAGGALFTAQLVMNPFYTAKFPYLNIDHGAPRLLPVELTMVNDLPVMLKVERAPIEYGSDPKLYLYLLDQNTYSPEPAGIWTKGGRRADLVVRAPTPLKNLTLVLSSPIPNHVWVSFDGRRTEVDLKPGQPMNIVIPSSEGIYSIGAYDYLLSVKPSDGMVPMLTEPGSKDRRFVGVLMQLKGTPR